MKNSIQVIPAILVKTQEEFIEQINAVQNQTPLAQLDIADGEFVPHATWSEPKIISQYAGTCLELHLMVSEPLTVLEKWIEVEQIKRVYIHLESRHVKRALEFARLRSWQAGLAVNPETESRKLEKYLELMDAALFMSVNPGQQGQGFIRSTLAKIAEFKKHHPNIFTAIDGAVNFSTLPDIIKSGVDAVCVGSAIFGNNKTPSENLKQLREMANRLT